MLVVVASCVWWVCACVSASVSRQDCWRVGGGSLHGSLEYTLAELDSYAGTIEWCGFCLSRHDDDVLQRYQEIRALRPNLSPSESKQ